MIRLVYAHPQPSRSRANRALLDAVRDVPGLSLLDLYHRYPDFHIDVAAEQQALTAASIVVLQHPLYWYAAPALLKQWLDDVFLAGWAYGGGQALAGKRLLWAPTTGAAAEAYQAGQAHGFDFAAFSRPWEQTARFCGMQWLPPFVTHGAQRLDDSELQAQAAKYRQLLMGLQDR